MLGQSETLGLMRSVVEQFSSCSGHVTPVAFVNLHGFASAVARHAVLHLQPGANTASHWLLPARSNAYIDVLKKLAEKYKDRPFSYLWAQGGDQEGLESNFGVGGFGG